MGEYLLVESQGTWVGPGCERFIDDAVVLAESGHHVWLFLVQDGVTAATGATVARLEELAGLGGRVWVDGFSLAQRSLMSHGAPPPMEMVEMKAVADKLLEPEVKAVWH